MKTKTSRQERRTAAAIERKAKKKPQPQQETLAEQFQELFKNPGFHLVVIDDETNEIVNIVNDDDLDPGDMEKLVESLDNG